MAPLRHSNLVNMVGASWKDGPDKLCLVLEFCSLGSVNDLFKAAEYTWATAYYGIALGTARCFRYLHHEQPNGRALLHRDLKSDNVLVSDDLSPKVADFGESRQYDAAEDDDETMTLCGTPMPVCPHVIIYCQLARKSQ